MRVEAKGKITNTTSNGKKVSNGKKASNGKKLTVLLAVVCTAVIGLMVLLVQPKPNTISCVLPESRDVFILYDNYNMTVVVVFDEEPPVVQFIAPDGNMVDMENIRYRLGSNFMQYFFPNAMPGVWRMAYDSLTNTEISTHYSVYMKHIFIRNFDVYAGWEVNEDIRVSFEVSADDAGEFNYELYAVFTAPDNSIAGEILLAKGYGMLNENIVLSVDAGEFQDMCGFMLRLTAYVQYGQAAVRDSAWLDLRLR